MKFAAILAAAAVAAIASPSLAQNRYRQVTLVSNMPSANPQILDEFLLDAWGIAIRPPGAGGHFWLTNAASGTVTEYVGDVKGVPLYQDDLRVVPIPTSDLYRPFPDTLSQPTGQVYTGWSNTDFMISGENITAASKFVFVALDGNITAWTTGQTKAVEVFDDSYNASMFTGVASTEKPSGNRLYVCDFGNECLRIFNNQFKEIGVSGAFQDPRVPGYVTPWNIQYLDGRLYIAWARQGDDPGEEDSYPGYGWISSFDEEGNLIQLFEHRLELNAPWGLAIAPDNFGSLSGSLLVANFGDGTIIAYDRDTGKYIDYLRDLSGDPMLVDGIWGMVFGNGVRLGRTNHMYYAAGPNAEEDGIFGKIVPLVPRAGDLNNDGAINKLDWPVLREAISLGNEDAFDLKFPLGEYTNGDVNADGAVDTNDVEPFVSMILKKGVRR